MAVTRLAEELFGPDEVHAGPAPGRIPLTVLEVGGSVVAVPHERAAAGRGFLRFTADTTPGDAARRLAGAAATAAAGGARLPGGHTVWIETGPNTLHAALCDATGVAGAQLWVALGPLRPNQKPVVRICGPRGRTVAFAKVGWNTLTRRLVDHEAEFLSGARFRGFDVPHVLGTLDHGGRRISVLGAVEGRPSLRRLDAPPPTVVSEIVHSAGPEEAPLGSSAHTARLTSMGGEAGEVVRWTADRWGDEIVTHGRWHGDFAPWNIGRRSRGRLAIWDWERTEAGIPAGFDLLHYSYQRQAARHGHHPWVMRSARAEAASALTELGVAPPAHGAVSLLYLASLVDRFTPEGEDAVDAVEAHRQAIADVLVGSARELGYSG